MYTTLEGENTYDTCLYEKDFSAFTPDPRVKAIVNGFSVNANFRELAIASIYLGDPETKFVTTNEDAVFINDSKTKRKKLDAGAFLGSLETVSGRIAVPIGKPNTLGFKFMLKDHFSD